MVQTWYHIALQHFGRARWYIWYSGNRSYLSTLRIEHGWVTHTGNRTWLVKYTANNRT